MNFDIIETRSDGTEIVHETVIDTQVKRALYNVGRRMGIIGKVTARELYDPAFLIDLPEVKEPEPDPLSIDVNYMTFAEAAEELGMRYQQVYQKAVVKGKLTYQQSDHNYVLRADVERWKQQRFERKAKAQA